MFPKVHKQLVNELELGPSKNNQELRESQTSQTTGADQLDCCCCFFYNDKRLCILLIDNFFYTYFTAIGASRYVGVTTMLNWSDAQAYCRQHYTDLASPLTLADNSLVQQVAIVQGFSWLGLFRDGWKWVDGTKVDQLLWKFPLPDNANPQQNCGTLNGGILYDQKCTSQYYFVCDFSESFTFMSTS